MRLPSVTIALVLAASACSPSVPDARSPVSVVVAPVAGRAPAASAPEMREPTGPALAFETVRDAIDRACPFDPNADVTTVTMEASEAALTECVRREADKARASFLAALALDDPRIERIAALDGALAHLVDDACWASEEVQWVDFKEGTRDDGTLRGFARLGCEARAEVERAYLFRAMAANAPAAFARHLDEAEPRGRREAFFLHELDAKAGALAAKSSPASLMPGERALGADARREYVARFAAIARAAPDLARVRAVRGARGREPRRARVRAQGDVAVPLARLVRDERRRRRPLRKRERPRRGRAARPKEGRRQRVEPSARGRDGRTFSATGGDYNHKLVRCRIWPIQPGSCAVRAGPDRSARS